MDAKNVASAFIALLGLLLRIATERYKAGASRAERARDERIGRLKALAETFEDAQRLVAQASTARRDVRDRLRIRPDSLRDDDGFKRRN